MPPNPHDTLAIRNLLALYCLALDTKDLTQLSQVFTPDVRASYPFPGGEMHGLETVQRVIAGRCVRPLPQKSPFPSPPLT